MKIFNRNSQLPYCISFRKVNPEIQDGGNPISHHISRREADSIKMLRHRAMTQWRQKFALIQKMGECGVQRMRLLSRAWV